jgi:hypothetical protein
MGRVDEVLRVEVNRPLLLDRVGRAEIHRRPAGIVDVAGLIPTDGEQVRRHIVGGEPQAEPVLLIEQVRELNVCD